MTVYWSTLLQVAGGVGLFLYGIRLMSEALQFIAGDRMRHLIGTLTRTPLRGVFVGILVTILIQSSSGTTVMTVSFVNASLMTLNQAIGIIMGANIGTTVTAQIIAFKIKDFALPFIALGVAFSVFGKTKKQRHTGDGIVGFGLLFLGMQTMESATAFLTQYQELFTALSRHPVLGVLAGTFVTMLVQSSAATIGLTMAMTSQGLLTLDSAIPIILGDNIGTTITAVLASIGTNRTAKQAAAAHVLFNFFGVVFFMCFLPLYKGLVVKSAVDISRQLANAHSIFNVVNTILFLPFTAVFAKLIRKILPAESIREMRGPVYLDRRLIQASPTAAVSAVKDELMHMGDIVLGMASTVLECYDAKPNLRENERLQKEFEESEEAVNAINRAISSYASEIWQQGLSGDVSTVLGCYVNAAGDLERVGDHFENLTELSDNRLDDGRHFSERADAEFQEMYATAVQALKLSLESLKNEDISGADYVIQTLEKQIDAQEKQFRKNHIERLNRGECNPEKGVVFIDILSNLERIGDHSHNIAYFTRDIVALSETGPA